MGEQKPNDSCSNNLAREISAVKRDKEALDQKEGESGKEQEAPPKSLLLSDHGKNVVIMGSLPGNVLSMVQRILGLATISGSSPAGLTDCHCHPVFCIVFISVRNLPGLNIFQIIVHSRIPTLGDSWQHYEVYNW